jgi:hypothetical protein
MHFFGMAADAGAHVAAYSVNHRAGRCMGRRAADRALEQKTVDDEFVANDAQTFSSQHQLQLAERLGFGIHGIIFVVEDKSKAGKTALKAHRSVEPYPRAQSLRLPRLPETSGQRPSWDLFLALDEQFYDAEADRWHRVADIYADENM